MAGSTGNSNFSLVVLSNRIPAFGKQTASDGTDASKSVGGLVAAVYPSVRGRNAAWIGWTGAEVPSPSITEQNDLTMVPVDLKKELTELHYEGFSNGTLWPLFHDVGVEPDFYPSWWAAYQEVNSIYANQAAELVQKGGVVWVHDYQLMLVPGLLRSLRPDIAIGYFHHIPFCPAKRFQSLPWSSNILASLVTSDIAGFQRTKDRENFCESVENSFRLDVSARAKVYPISVDFASVSSAAEDSRVFSRAAVLRKEWGNPGTVFLGADRIDYTKGILERLEAYEALLLSHQLSVEDTVLVQVGSPSRMNVKSYQDLGVRVEETVSRINQKFQSSVGRPAVIYRAENLDRAEMLSLFVAADVMIVSSLRDGMNLVSKEYIACRNDETGVLILSPYAGAADRLVNALIVDPTNSVKLQTAMLEAVAMSREEQKQRMVALRDEVRTHNVGRWAQEFLVDLASESTRL